MTGQNVELCGGLRPVTHIGHVHTTLNAWWWWWWRQYYYCHVWGIWWQQVIVIMTKGKWLRKPSHLLSVVHTGPWSTCDIFCEPPICIEDICIPVRKRKVLLLILDALINLVQEKWLLRELMKSWRLSGGEFLLTSF